MTSVETSGVPLSGIGTFASVEPKRTGAVMSPAGPMIRSTSARREAADPHVAVEGHVQGVDRTVAGQVVRRGTVPGALVSTTCGPGMTSGRVSRTNGAAEQLVVRVLPSGGVEDIVQHLAGTRVAVLVHGVAGLRAGRRACRPGSSATNPGGCRCRPRLRPGSTSFQVPLSASPLSRPSDARRLERAGERRGAQGDRRAPPRRRRAVWCNFTGATVRVGQESPRYPDGLIRVMTRSPTKVWARLIRAVTLATT